MSFKLIKHWREVFKLPVRFSPQIPSDAEEQLSISLIEEELEEYKQSCKSPGLNERADAIGDLFFVVAQAAYIHGFDPEELIKTVYESNMSKGCTNQIDVDKSIEAYKQKGIQVFYQKVNPDFYVIRRLSDGKTLKSINFKEPNWNYDESLKQNT